MLRAFLLQYSTLANKLTPYKKPRFYKNGVSLNTFLNL